jgi:heavy metal efflux system protein
MKERVKSKWQKTKCKRGLLNSKLEKIVCSLFFAFYTLNTNAQTITLQNAIETALNNNLKLKSEKLYAEYQAKLKNFIGEIPLTTIVGDYGQINSVYNDTKLGISQTISYPTVYKTQKALQNENYKGSLLNISIRENELQRQVSEVFYLYIYLKQKQQILLKSDSIYTEFLEKTTLRFSKGESNILEKTTAQTQKGQITIQLNQLNNELDIVALQFQLLLNTTTLFVPSSNISKINLIELLDIQLVNNHPQIKFLEQQKNISSANSQVEKSKLLPSLSLGFSNQSIQGNGADNVYYSASKRFNSLQIGVGIPIFSKSQKIKIDASKTLEAISENNYQNGLQALKTEYEVVYKQYIVQLQTIKYFEDEALQNAKTITKTATQQFTNGEINYLTWTMLINNAIAIQSNYVDAVNELNQSIIHLNYLISKNQP